VSDYGHDLLFGVFLTPAADAPHDVVGRAQLADDVGLDLVTVQDHPYQPRHVDTWTLLSVIGARTQRVRVAPNVANLPLRPPVVLARSVATLDLLTGGRVELGIGAGAFWDAISGLGGPRLTPAQSVEALEEGIEVIRGMWARDGQPVRHRGQHYLIRGAKPGPLPVHDVEIWIGAYKPRMLRLTGRAGDGWLPTAAYLPPEQLAEANARIDDAASAAGRDPSAVRRLYNIGGSFGAGTGFLRGPARDWAEQLAELALKDGMSAFILAADDPDDIRRFAGEVAPAVRELVAGSRGSGTPSQPSSSPSATGSSGAGDVSAPATRSAADAGPLAVYPTVDDGTRLSSERLWDEDVRPTGPAPEQGRLYTAHEQVVAHHLVDVHDGLRGELRQLRDLIDQVAAGVVDPASARSHINAMTLRQNNWTLGAYCESYCRIVTGHHSIEDASVFPHLRSRDPRLRPVIDRLEDEHRLIHDVLETVDRALVRLVADNDLGPLRAAVDLLTDTLLSHLAYEERELIEPLARLGFY
jgi:alkanesulfonate monooxygenase SsuD/methylene tetrahydromethanopterin reductase-like flavin-dependent oxidoreductase (luciferase family)